MNYLLKERRISALVFPCTAAIILYIYILCSVLSVRPVYGTRMAFAALAVTLVWAGLFIWHSARVRRGKARCVLTCSPVTALALAAFLGLYFAWAVWGSRYLTLAPLEQIDSGTQKLDSMYHAALSESFRRGIFAGTLLNSEGIIPYHSFSHLLISLVSRVLGTPGLITYCYMYPMLFIPAFLGCQLFAVSAAKEHFSGRTEIRLRDLGILVLLNAGFLYDPWLDMYGVWKRQAIYSESYLAACMLAYLSYGIILRVLSRPEAGGPGKKRMKLLLLLWISASLFIITWCKVSVGIVFAVPIFYYIFRIHIREIRCWGLNLLYGCVLLAAVWLFNFMGGGYQPAEQTLFRKFAFSPYCPGPLGMFGHWLILMILPGAFLVLEILRLRKEARIFRTGKTVWIEAVLLTAFAAFLPGFIMVIEGGSAAFFSWAVEIPGLLLLTSHPTFNAEWGRSVRPAVKRTGGILLALWCICMCWINKPADPMNFVTGQHESALSEMLLEIREKTEGHPEQYTVYLDPDNIALRTFRPDGVVEMKTMYLWPAMTGVGVINATCIEDGRLCTYTGSTVSADFGVQNTDNDHLLTLEEALEKAKNMGKKAVIHVTAEGYEMIE